MPEQSLENQTMAITGANTGIGRATLLALAAQRVGRLIVLARSAERTQPVIDEIVAKHPECAVHFVPIDLGSLAAVRRAADTVLGLDFTIDVLINNAGIAGVQGQTSDGFELAWGTNHVGHYLLTEKLLPLVKRSGAGRIVIVASRAHYRAKGIDWDAVTQTTRTLSAFPEYCVSKLANVLHASELAHRLTGTTVTTYSVHPGGVASDIWRRRLGVFAALLRPFLITNEEGAKTQLRCATDPQLRSDSGLYYERERAKVPSRLALDQTLRDELRARSDEWVKPFLA